MNDTIKNELDRMDFFDLAELAKEVRNRQCEMLEEPMREAAKKVMAAIAELQTEVKNANRLVEEMGRDGYGIDFLNHNDCPIYIDELKGIGIANVDCDDYIEDGVFEFKDF